MIINTPNAQNYGYTVSAITDERQGRLQKTAFRVCEIILTG